MTSSNTWKLPGHQQGWAAHSRLWYQRTPSDNIESVVDSEKA